MKNKHCKAVIIFGCTAILALVAAAIIAVNLA